MSDPFHDFMTGKLSAVHRANDDGEGANPPPHIARLLDKQMEAFATVAPIIFALFKVFTTSEKPPDKK